MPSPNHPSQLTDDDVDRIEAAYARQLANDPDQAPASHWTGYPTEIINRLPPVQRDELEALGATHPSQWTEELAHHAIDIIDRTSTAARRHYDQHREILALNEDLHWCGYPIKLINRLTPDQRVELDQLAFSNWARNGSGLHQAVTEIIDRRNHAARVDWDQAQVLKPSVAPDEIAYVHNELLRLSTHALRCAQAATDTADAQMWGRRHSQALTVLDAYIAVTGCYDDMYTQPTDEPSRDTSATLEL